MHVNAFNADPENGRLADEMGVVVGTSHCDMLLRSNQHEFDPWVEKKGYHGLLYDYSLPGQRSRLREYWRESVEQNASYEVSFTLGMRGIHDSGFRTRAIDEDASLSEEEKRTARVRLLEEVIRDQREIIRTTLHHARADEALPQTFAPPRYAVGRGEKKDVIAQFGEGVFSERDGTLCLEAEYALEESRSAWLTADGAGIRREHLQAETDGGSGLAMYVERRGLFWEEGGPAMHYRCRFSGGKYYVWLLTRFDDATEDACAVGVDGRMQPRAAQYGGGAFFTYSSQFLWVWTLLSEMEIPAGEHVFSVAAVRSGLRIDRIYLTKGRELPPDDGHFSASKRTP